MSILTWQPPRHKPRRVDSVAAELVARPGTWALVAPSVPTLEFFPWWLPLERDNRFEVRRVPVNPDVPALFSRHDVYARYVGPGVDRRTLEDDLRFIRDEARRHRAELRDQLRARMDRMYADFGLQRVPDHTTQEDQE